MKKRIALICCLFFLAGSLQLVQAQTNYSPVPVSSIDSTVYSFAAINEDEFGKGYGSDQHPNGYGINIKVNNVANSPGEITELSQDGCVDIYKLSYKVYDIDYDGEVRVYINNVYVAYVLATGDLTSKSRKIEFCGSLLSPGNNLIEFRVENSNRVWGVKDILLKYKIINSVNIDFNTNSSLAYGNGFGTNQHLNHIVMNFDGTQNRSYLISITGWDIDQSNEISMYFNDNFIGFLDAGCNQCLSSSTNIDLEGSLVLDGRNQLVFIQRSTNEQWGITDFKLNLKSNITPVINLLLL